MGYKFMARSSNKVELEILEHNCEEWLTMVIFPFDSSSKRISVIVKNAITNDFWLWWKGGKEAGQAWGGCVAEWKARMRRQ